MFVIFCQVQGGVEDLSNSLQDRQAFYERWSLLEKWLNKTQRKADAVRECYSDEVNDVHSKMEVKRFYSKCHIGL